MHFRRFFCLISLLVLTLPAVSQSPPSNTGWLSQIRGQVFLPDGRPAGEGVQIQLMPGSGGVSQDVQTDSTGKFYFPGASPVRYTIRAHMTGYGDATDEFDMSVEPSHYSHITLRALPKNQALPPEGAASMISVLPADMPDAAKSEFSDGFAIITSGKNLGRAVPHFKKVIEIYPRYSPTYLLLGTAYARTGKESDAITALHKAIELDPKSADAYTILGGILNQQKKFADAERNLSKAVEISPTSYEAQYQLGRAYFYEQKPADAQQHLQAALQANPRSAEAHIMMANVQLHLRNAEGALKEYQEGEKLDPKGPMAEGARQMIARIQTALTARKK